MDEVEKSDRHALDIDAEKKCYKVKVKLANQRIKQLLKSLEDVAFRVVGKLLETEIEKESDELEKFEKEVNIMNARLKIKEAEIKDEVAFSKKFIELY